jgi:hypothetical protein
MLRRMFGSDRLEIMYNEDVRNPYCSANTIRIISSRKMRWAGHVGYMGEMMLKRMFGSDRLEIMYNEDIHNPYCSSNTIRIACSRKMRWAGRVGYMAEMTS